MNTTTKLALDFGPLFLFFLANWYGGKDNGLYLGTAVFMVAVLLALAAQWWLTRKLSPMTLVSAVFVGVFGGLTLWFQDKVFIQVKATLLYALFGIILLGGLAFGRSYLKLIMDSAMHMHDAAWRTLTLRWGLFFIALAVLNEVLRQKLSWDQWVTFKTFGVLPLIMVFAVANAPYMAKHMHEESPKN